MSKWLSQEKKYLDKNADWVLGNPDGYDTDGVIYEKKYGDATLIIDYSDSSDIIIIKFKDSPIDTGILYLKLVEMIKHGKAHKP